MLVLVVLALVLVSHQSSESLEIHEHTQNSVHYRAMIVCVHVIEDSIMSITCNRLPASQSWDNPSRTCLQGSKFYPPQLLLHWRNTATTVSPEAFMQQDRLTAPWRLDRAFNLVDYHSRVLQWSFCVSGHRQQWAIRNSRTLHQGTNW